MSSLLFILTLFKFSRNVASAFRITLQRLHCYRVEPLEEWNFALATYSHKIKTI